MEGHRRTDGQSIDPFLASAPVLPMITATRSRCSRGLKCRRNRGQSASSSDRTCSSTAALSDAHRPRRRSTSVAEAARRPRGLIRGARSASAFVAVAVVGVAPGVDLGTAEAAARRAAARASRRADSASAPGVQPSASGAPAATAPCPAPCLPTWATAQSRGSPWSHLNARNTPSHPAKSLSSSRWSIS